MTNLYLELQKIDFIGQAGLIADAKGHGLLPIDIPCRDSAPKKKPVTSVGMTVG
jgi:hypothetical protein